VFALIMATKFITHLTVVGERWDSLAWIYYGDATLFSPIIMANPSIPVESVFEAGLAIGIPVLQVTPIAPDSLPPWKTSN
jgi:phage tail protein X